MKPFKTNTVYKIDKNVPIPGRGPNSGGVVGALKNMEVGDSIELPVKDIPTWRTCSRYAGTKVAVRTISKEKARVWKIA